ncbi:MAG: zinc ribbon domain-containing protein [Deltaproteobacteria bacterium]|nr:zinc ribbon domain-containing protein [Deltaproteobacteria bacterium]
MNICLNCQANNESDAMFCTECGHALAPNPIKNTNIENSSAEITADINDKKINRVLLKHSLMAITGVIILISAYIWVVIFAIGSDKKSNFSHLESINVIQSSSKSVAGLLDKNAIELNIPEDTFEGQVRLKVEPSGNIPSIDTDRAQILGPLYKISSEQNSKRLNRAVKVKFKLSKSDIDDSQYPHDFMGAYFDGKQWNLFRPEVIDLANGFIEFKTYHFSDWAKANPTREEMISLFSREMAVDKWSKNSKSKPVNDAVNQILLSHFGIQDKSLTQDIVESMMNEGDFQKILVDINDNNSVQFGQDVAVLAGKQIVKVLNDNDTALKAVLGSVSEHSSKIGTAVKMAVAIKNGDYTEAAKELSREIINSYPLTRLFREGTKVIAGEIKRWKTAGIENAYDVYVNGVDRYGYKGVEVGNFEQIWEQMKGVRRQLYIDAKKKYAEEHNMNPSDLSMDLQKKIEADVKETTSRSFSERRKEEVVILKEQEFNIKLLNEFEKAHLLDKNRFGYTENTSFEVMMTRLFNLKNMILSDTNCRIGFTGINANGIISADRVAGLIQIWYTKPDGKDKYREELKKLGYIKDSKTIGKKSDSGLNLDNRLVGEWVFKNSEGGFDRQIYNSDGTAVRYIYNQKYDWLWSTGGNRLKLYVKNGKPAYQVYKIEGDKLFFYVDSAKVWSVPFIKR